MHTLWHGYSPVNLLYIFRTAFRRNTSGGLLLKRKFFLNKIPVSLKQYQKEKQQQQYKEFMRHIS